MKKEVIILLMIFNIFAFGYNEPFKYDPFARYTPLITKDSNGTKIASKNVIKVSAVMSNKAFINGNWYKLGKKFGSYKIITIKPNMVRLRKKSKTLVLPVGEHVTKYLKIKDKN